MLVWLKTNPDSFQMFQLFKVCGCWGQTPVHFSGDHSSVAAVVNLAVVFTCVHTWLSPTHMSICDTLKNYILVCAEFKCKFYQFSNQSSDFCDKSLASCHKWGEKSRKEKVTSFTANTHNNEAVRSFTQFCPLVRLHAHPSPSIM